ncbi:MAG: hypothetical protein H0X40_17820 [Chthoniobacterales bacterium]|nr:hypothetical protein [Chthoniobacterales bacterium]
MTDFLAFSLRLAGAGLLLLAAIHTPLSRHLRWREQAALLTPINAAIFRVHNLFIVLVLILMGLPCLLDPRALLELSRAALWGDWSLAAFWAIRLYCQLFVYEPALWRGLRREAAIHWWFVFVWIGLTALFILCGLQQLAR